MTGCHVTITLSDGTSTMTGCHVTITLSDGTCDGDVAVLPVHVVSSATRVVTNPDTKILHRCLILLENNSVQLWPIGQDILFSFCSLPDGPEFADRNSCYRTCLSLLHWVPHSSICYLKSHKPQFQQHSPHFYELR